MAFHMASQSLVGCDVPIYRLSVLSYDGENRYYYYISVADGEKASRSIRINEVGENYNISVIGEPHGAMKPEEFRLLPETEYTFYNNSCSGVTGVHNRELLIRTDANGKVILASSTSCTYVGSRGRRR